MNILERVVISKWNTLSTLPAVQFTVQIPVCRFRFTIMLIIRQFLYAASKKANELMAHTYSHLYGLPTTGLRFFTVYGPWGRPDMALFIFTRNILAGEPIDVFNQGNHQRDFTYIDDIVEGIIRTLEHVAEPNPAWNGDEPDSATSRAPYRLYNIGSNNPIQLLRYIEIIEACLGQRQI